MERTLHLAWLNFWPGFLEGHDEGSRRVQTLFTRMLFPWHEVEITIPEKADIVIGSSFGALPLPDKALKVLFLGENWSVPWFQYDYSFSHCLEGTIEGCTNFTLPLFALCQDLPQLLYPPLPWETESKGFCSFVVSNPNCSVRNRFFDRLHREKAVASGGRYLNNIGHSVGGGHSNGEITRFLHSYRFNICFENSVASGYNTEKLTQAMSAGTLPIYWGSKSVCDYFNQDSFLYLQEDASNFESLYQEVLALEADQQKYLHRLIQPRILESTVRQFSSASLARMGEKIVTAL